MTINSDTAASTNGIVACGVSHRYGDRAILEDISFWAQQGRVTALLGPNGAGKTTLMRIALGLVHGAGEVRFDGDLFTDLSQPWRRVGAVVDGGAFHLRRSALNHLRMVADASGINRRRVDECLALVGLDNVAKTAPGKYSLGMRQRLGIAVALLGRPGVLVLDEPANGLDPHGVRWLRDLLRSLAESGAAILLSSHLLSEVENVADDVVLISRGRVMLREPLVELLARSGSGVVKVRTDQIAELSPAVTRKGGRILKTVDDNVEIADLDVRAIGQIVHEERIKIHGLSEVGPRLDDLFVDLTSNLQDYTPIAGSTS
jgi:ABC-2 type transport system ATP-binding protein